MTPTNTKRRLVVDESAYRAVLRAERAGARFYLVAAEAAAALRNIPQYFTLAIPEAQVNDEESAIRLAIAEEASSLALFLEEGEFGCFSLEDCETLMELVEHLRDLDRYHAGEFCDIAIRSLSNRAKELVAVQQEMLKEREEYRQSDGYRERYLRPVREEARA